MQVPKNIDYMQVNMERMKQIYAQLSHYRKTGQVRSTSQSLGLTLFSVSLIAFKVTYAISLQPIATLSALK